MTWQDALEISIFTTGHNRFRVLCADEDPLHEGYRAEVLRITNGNSSPPESDAARAARLIAEFPPDPSDRNPCGCQ